MSTTTLHPASRAWPAMKIPSWAFVAGATIMLGLVFLTGEHRWDRSGLKDYVESAEERAVAATAGNNVRRLAFLALGATGFLMLAISGQLPALREPMGMCLLLAFGWTFSSFVWAGSPGFTLKRLALLVLCIFGVMGFASSMTLRQLSMTALCVTTFYLGMGVFAEVTQGNFRPWAGGYRFAGTLHPNGQATNCGVMALSAFAVWRRTIGNSLKKHLNSTTTTGGSKFALLLFVVAVFFLLLTKSRTAAAAIILVIGLVWSTRQKLGINLMVAGAGLLAVVTLFYAVSVTGAAEDVGESANMGRADSEGAFNGRLPIWEICLGRVGAKIPVGFGYDGFWTPERIEDVSWELGWSISSAHSEYIEIALGLGLIGLALYLVTMFAGIAWFWLRYFRLGHGADAMVFGLLLIGAIQGFMETGYLHPNSLAPFVCMVAMARLSFFSDHEAMWKGVI